MTFFVCARTCLLTIRLVEYEHTLARALQNKYEILSEYIFLSFFYDMAEDGAWYDNLPSYEFLSPNKLKKV